jgi:enamine deaminase RidA (YjgF/YER057c/UK114 family)
LQKIGRALAVAGASFTDVVRTRMYIVNLADGEAAGRAHGEIFSAIRPAATLIAVQALVEPELLVEIEAEAYLSTRE